MAFPNQNEPDSEGEDYLERGSSLIKADRFREAITLYEETLADLERTYGEDDPQLGHCLLELGQAYEAGARLNDALRIHIRRLRLCQQVMGKADPLIVEMLFKLTQINEKLGRPAEALVYCDQALQTAKQCMAQDDPLSQQIIARHRYLSNLAASQAHLAEGGFSSIKNEWPEEVSDLAEPDESDQGTTGQSKEESDDEDDDRSGSEEDSEDQAATIAPTPVSAEEAGQAKAYTGDIYSQIKSARSTQARKPEKEHFSPQQLLRDFALPVVGLLTVIGLFLFFVLQKPSVQKAATPAVQSPTSTAIYSRFKTADGTKEILLEDDTLALLATASSAMELPYMQIVPDWSGLFSAFTWSVREKQLWAEKKESELKTEDNTVYYSADGPELLVIEKMQRLAGYAQACYLRMGEYPRLVSNDMVRDFSMLNPLSSKDEAIQIRPLMPQAGDGIEAIKALESGFNTGDEPANTPCKITCYAVLTGTPGTQTDKLKATKFYVRGCNRNGIFITSGPANQTYVISASDKYLLALTAAQSVPVKAGSKSQETKQDRSRGKGKGKQNAKQPSTQQAAANLFAPVSASPKQDLPTILPTVPREKPTKPTKFWIISNPPLPLYLIHHALPLLFFGLALPAFFRAQMKAVDSKGRTISSGSRPALIIALVSLALCVLAIIAQYVIFI